MSVTAGCLETANRWRRTKALGLRESLAICLFDTRLLQRLLEITPERKIDPKKWQVLSAQDIYQGLYWLQQHRRPRSFVAIGLGLLIDNNSENENGLTCTWNNLPLKRTAILTWLASCNLRAAKCLQHVYANAIHATHTPGHRIFLETLAVTQPVTIPAVQHRDKNPFLPIHIRKN
jgi:hypothetical protein